VTIEVGSITEVPLLVTATVRLASFAVCTTELAVTPVATTTVHCIRALRVLVAADKVNVAVEVPEFVPAALNEVEPHPCVVGVAGDAAMVNVGNISDITSAETRGIFNANMIETLPAPRVTAFEMSKTLLENAGISTADDAIIGIAVELTAPRNEACRVRLAALDD
jgi:hypothetical protein